MVEHNGERVGYRVTMSTRDAEALRKLGNTKGLNPNEMLQEIMRFGFWYLKDHPDALPKRPSQQQELPPNVLLFEKRPNERQ